MLIQAVVAEAKAILGAMHRVATGNGRQGLSEACASGLRSYQPSNRWTLPPRWSRENKKTPRLGF